MATAYRPRTSLAWDHFEIKDREKGIATCNICHVAFSYRTSVSNLKKHLKNKHGYSYSTVRGEDDENEHTENGEKSVQSKFKTELWEYYQVKDEENKQATCTICLDQFSFAESLAELFQHLKDKHAIDFGKDAEKSDDDTAAPDDDDGDSSVPTVSEHKPRPKSSLAWDYFEIKDDDKKVASCLTCGALCSFRSSVSNLMKHARRKHGVHIEMQEEDGVIDSLDAVAEVVDSKIFAEQTNRAQRSIVWLYFKKLGTDNKLSQCLLCHKTLSHSTTVTNLKKHLSRKHPNVKIPSKEDGQKRILLSSGGELFEVETTSQFDEDADDDALQNDTLEMDTVFLEDFDTLQEEKPTKVKAPSKRKRSCSTSSEEEITFVNRYKRKPSDSFDHFAKYLASLLRSLPKQKASKLQVEFLKQIMDVEIDALKD